LVAESNGKIVGTVLGTHDGRKGWINRQAVDHVFRRKNIAKKLVSEAEKWFEESGLEIFACVIENHFACKYCFLNLDMISLAISSISVSFL
jgi:ribosomal protein S18 acetylase RimI-like enzyme